MQRKIDWPNHLISFVLIIFSILLAFQVEKCGTDRKQDRLVAAHLAEIRAETVFNQGQLQQTMDGLSATKARLDTLIGLLRTASSETDTREINRLVFAGLNVPFLYLKTNAYNSFTTSGDIRFMDDFAGKSAVVNLYEFHEQAAGFSDLLLETYQDSYFGYIKEHLDLGSGRPQPLAVYQERVFVNGISSYYYFVIRCQGIFKQHQQRMADFIDQSEVTN